MSRFICCICEKTLAEGRRGQDVVVGPCAKCREQLKRELGVSFHYTKQPKRFEFVRRAA